MKIIRNRILYACAMIVTICLCISQMFYVNVKAANDANYTNMTIYAKDNQGNVIGSMTGMFTKGTKLAIENNRSKLDAQGGRNYFELRDFTGNNNIPYYDVFSYGVKVIDGSYKGKIVTTFNLDNYPGTNKIGNKYDNMNATVIMFNHPNGNDAFGNDDYISSITNGKVNVTINYPSLSNQMMFMIGIPLVNDPTQTQQSNRPSTEQQIQSQQSQNQQPKESMNSEKSYKDLTLDGTVKNEKANVKGTFTDNSKLDISEITKDNDNYKKLAASMPNNKTIGAYDVKVINGSYKGKLNVKFTVDKRYVNKNVTIKHLLDDGNIESNTVKVTSDNTVEMTVSSLSPFMIFGEDNSATGLNTQQYIEIGGGIILVIVIIGCTVAIIKSKKRK